MLLDDHSRIFGRSELSVIVNRFSFPLLNMYPFFHLYLRIISTEIISIDPFLWY